MTTYYKEENKEITKSTPFEKVAKTWGSYETTEENIVRGYDGKLYLESECPETPPPTEEEQRQKRQQAFTEEADPLRYNYDEDCARYGYDSEQALASKEIWLAKKDEIRERYPYPVDTDPEYDVLVEG